MLLYWPADIGRYIVSHMTPIATMTTMTTVNVWRPTPDGMRIGRPETLSFLGFRVAG